MKFNVLVKKYKYIIIIVSLLALFVSMCEAGKCEKQIENFDIGTEKGKHCVLFHSKNCGWCKKMMPEWKKFKKAHSGDLKITEVEASEDPDTIQKHNINGFPTIVLFDNGKKTVHKGERTKNAFKQFVGLN